MSVTSIEIVAALLFALAIVHTFATRQFEHLAHVHPRHAGLWHLLGEVEIALGFWAFVLLLFMALDGGWTTVSEYMATRHFVEPVFVFAIMVIAASRPILQLARVAVAAVGRVLPMARGTAEFVLALSFVPLLGSLITEPAAMTVAALMLRDGLFSRPISTRLKYATLGVLFVNVSIGGTLTNFAAPPVLMVAGAWEWSTGFMFAQFGWKAALAVLVNTALLTILFRAQLKLHAGEGVRSVCTRVPAAFVAVNVGLLVAVVLANDRPEVFMGAFLLFLGLSEAYPRHHDRLMLREGLMVAFFLSGLVVLGGQQRWWLQPLLARLDEPTLFLGAAALTAITDNAALTYLGSQVGGMSEGLRYALVAGAVAGGGLTVIANAPNPAGFAILGVRFEERAINPFGLIVAALPPTVIALVALRAPGGFVMDLFDLEQWGIWLSEIDRGILFLFLLPFVVAAFALLGELLRAWRPESRPSARTGGAAGGEPELREAPAAHGFHFAHANRRARESGPRTEASSRREPRQASERTVAAPRVPSSRSQARFVAREDTGTT